MIAEKEFPVEDSIATLETRHRGMITTRFKIEQLTDRDRKLFFRSSTEAAPGLQRKAASR